MVNSYISSTGCPLCSFDRVFCRVGTDVTNFSYCVKCGFGHGHSDELGYLSGDELFRIIAVPICEFVRGQMCDAEPRLLDDRYYLDFVSSLDGMTVDECRDILYPFFNAMTSPFETGELFY